MSEMDLKKSIQGRLLLNRTIFVRVIFVEQADILELIIDDERNIKHLLRKSIKRAALH
jgi:DNA repair exonuclease SbcCD ATPase subunit